jgi:hypothetical protein
MPNPAQSVGGIVHAGVGNVKVSSNLRVSGWARR